MGEETKVYKVLVGKPEGKRPLERPRCRMGSEWILLVKEFDWGMWSGFSWLKIGWLLCIR
jgi:hypothetical protein